MSERLAIMERMRAAGMLPRYRVILPNRFWTIAQMREDDRWHIRVFGRRSDNRKRARTLSRITFKLFETIRNNRVERSHGVNRLYWRARDAYLERGCRR